MWMTRVTKKTMVNVMQLAAASRSAGSRLTDAPKTSCARCLGACSPDRSYSDYITIAVACNQKYIHASTFNRYLAKLLPWIEVLQKETIELVRYLVVRYGDTIEGLVLTND